MKFIIFFSVLFSLSIVNAQPITPIQNLKDSIQKQKQSLIQEQRVISDTTNIGNPSQASSAPKDKERLISQYLAVFRYYSSQFSAEKNTCESSYKQMVNNSTETLRKNAQQSPTKKSQEEQLQLAEFLTNTRSIAARAACFLRFSYETEFLLTGKLDLGDDFYDYMLKNQLSQAGVKTISDFLKMPASVWAPQYLKVLPTYPNDLDNFSNLMFLHPGYGCKSLNNNQTIFECN